MANSKVNWYKSDVMLIVEGASDEILTALALQTEGEAKPRAPVDTGFMRNAIYTVAPGIDGREAAEAAARGSADRPLAPELGIEEHEAAVHAAAEYTIYQETRVGFLYGALQSTARLADGIIREVGRRWFV